MGLADLHIHTIYSYDGTASVPAVLTRAKQIGLDVIAITDHDEIAGSLKALELASKYGVQVIPAIEITTAEGDLLALMSAGAYTMSMSSNYNSRPRAAEVLVDDASAHLVRRRESIDELFALEHIPA